MDNLETNGHRCKNNGHGAGDGWSFKHNGQCRLLWPVVASKHFQNNTTSSSNWLFDISNFVVICFKDEYKHSFTKWTRLKLFIIKSYIMISICMELSIRLYGHSSFFCVCVSSPQFAMHRQIATSSNSLLLLHSRPTSPFFPFHLIQSVTFVKIWTQMNIRIYCTKKFTRTIIRIYLYQKI